MTLPSLELIEALPGRGLLVRVTSGPCSGQVVLIAEPGAPPPPPQIVRSSLPSTRDFPGRSDRARRSMVARSPRSERVAEELLLSLLDDAQRASWQKRGEFWVATASGSVRLGRLYDLVHRQPDGRERSLCVVPSDHSTLPTGDIWATLLLALTHYPDRFFRVANVNGR